MNTPVKCSVTALIVVRSAFKLGVWEGAFAGARDLGAELEKMLVASMLVGKRPSCSMSIC